jgi:aerobic-type carbon monoxide dehydrogenase small subunit (CoxS/CutS family)
MSKEKNEPSNPKTTRRTFIKGLGAGAVVAAAAVAGVEEYRIAQQPAITPPPLTHERAIKLDVNGNTYEFVADNRLSLRDALRDKLGLIGTKDGCGGLGECGACTVLADGKPILSCLTLAIHAQNMKIVTSEGLGNSSAAALDPVQQAFLDNDGFQCGYCTGGFMMLTKGFLAENPHPSEQEIREALAGNLCRCGAYLNIIKSVIASAAGSS